VIPSAISDRENRVGVLDIGSNSVRLVVFEGGRRMPIPIFNEKALCALGADLRETGRLSETGRISAIANIGRFTEIAREMELSRLDVLATAAVREAENGDDFVQYLQRRLGLQVQVLSGDEEARLSAQGVLSAFPDADGVMGDLGGGSLEMVDISAGDLSHQATMPLGPLRFSALTNRNRADLEALIDGHLRKIDWLDRLSERPIYAVGGAWRSLARAHMADNKYPLEVIHGYEIDGEEALDYLDQVSGVQKNQIPTIPGVAVRRSASVSMAALILSRVMRLGRASGLKFSAFGLREGCLYDQLPQNEKSQDPLLASCSMIAGKSGRFPLAPELVEQWIRGFLPDLSARDARLVSAIAILSDLAWAEHPRYRGEHAFLKVLRLPVVGISHEERVFVALVVLARYTGATKLRGAAAAAGLIPAERRGTALKIGLALRLGLTLCAGVGRMLAKFEVQPNYDWVSIVYPSDMVAVHGEAVGRRMNELSQALGMPVVIEPALPSRQLEDG
jgi:exopolyphosphatase/guanosine-5'-triphosphate,3'-diphosphate pyrophosphatase